MTRHFLDLFKVPPADLRAILDEARRRKVARGERPKGAADARKALSTTTHRWRGARSP